MCMITLDEEWLELPPWGTSGPVMISCIGPIPFSMAPQLIAAALKEQDEDI